VKNVVLMTCWSEGWRGAEQELLEVGWTPPFIDMERVGGFDIFCPFRNKKMVIVDGKIDPGKRDEDEEEQDIHPSTLDNLEHDPIIQGEPDIEDMAGEELSHLECNSPSQMKHEAFLVVDAELGGNTYQHKSSILRIFSDNNPNSMDHLKRVQDLSQFNDTSQGLAVGDISDPNEPRVHIEDPATTLVCSKNLIWLAVVQISDIHMDHTGIQSLPTHLLSEPNVSI
jgi:hypothetical protein